MSEAKKKKNVKKKEREGGIRNSLWGMYVGIILLQWCLGVGGYISTDKSLNNQNQNNYLAALRVIYYVNENPLVLLQWKQMSELNLV